MGINFGALAVTGVAVLGIVLLVVAIGVGIKALKGDVKKSTGSLIVVVIAAVIAAVAIGGTAVAIGSGILGDVFA